ncbi:MAG: hypothetical protein QMD85_05205 [Candidatus Aenigmarchaeota archaeon]|nr:hypothetical protein [Candidatus Aenigmarchaeota archaeon]
MISRIKNPIKYGIIGALVNLVIVLSSFVLTASISRSFFVYFRIEMLIIGIVTGFLAGVLCWHFLEKSRTKIWKKGGIIGVLSVFLLFIITTTTMTYGYMLSRPIDLIDFITVILTILVLTVIWIIPGFLIGAIISYIWDRFE